MNFSWSAHNKIYWKCLHVMCLCYSILQETDPDTMISMKGFLVLFSELIPNKKWGTWMSDFIDMTPSTKKELFSNETLKIYLTGHEPQSIDYYLTCSKEQVDLLEWSWILHEHINYKRRKEGEDISGVSLTQFKKDYNRNKISKDQWGRPMWFVIHSFALHMPDTINSDLKLKYKAFLSSLQFVLPCPVCKQHIKENLGKLEIDSYFNSNKSLFEWTVKLHNVVNKDSNKNVISLRESYELYTVKDGSNGSDESVLERIFL